METNNLKFPSKKLHFNMNKLVMVMAQNKFVTRMVQLLLHIFSLKEFDKSISSRAAETDV